MRKRLSAAKIKEVAGKFGVVKIDCRARYFWVRDKEGFTRLGHYPVGATERDLRYAIRKAKETGRYVGGMA